MNPPPGQIPVPQLLVLLVVAVLIFGFSRLRSK
jgi:Sec-independent protein translocase protein TatA